MGKKSNKYKEMIIRYLEGQLLDNEYEELSSFLSEKENLRLFDETKKYWTPSTKESRKADQNWIRLRSRIARNKVITGNIKSNKRYFQWAYRAAAILIIGLIVGLTIINLRNTSKLAVNQTIIETPRGEKSKITLPDGSEVWLNSSSELRYSSFTTKLRQVSLKGEAYFNIKRSEKALFKVITERCDIEVFGTKFNVMAYDDFHRNEITLISGKVNIRASNKTIEMIPGERTIIKNESITKERVPIEQSIGWVDNTFIFDDILLTELIKRLELRYDVDIDLELGSESDVSFGGTFKNEETIWQVLDAINVYVPIEYERTSSREISMKVK